MANLQIIYMPVFVELPSSNMSFNFKEGIMCFAITGSTRFEIN